MSTTNKSVNNNGSPKPVRKPVAENYDLAKSEETLHLATDLARFIKENRLFQNIQGKEYVNVEGWQYAGSRLGIFPVVTDLENKSTDTEIKYLAKVQLINLRTDQVVGAGYAVCSNKEQGRKFYMEYAIASMAQTRAIGKAYRNILAWIIRAAGYEPTPAEEMDYQNHDVLESRINTYVQNHGKSGNLRAAAPAPAEEATPKPAVEAAAPAAAPAPEVPAFKPATAKQKEQIIKLLNHPMVKADEKNKMLLKINDFDEERAYQAIAKLKKTIQERESTDTAAA